MNVLQIFLLFFGVTVSFAVYKLMTDSSSRRPQWQDTIPEYSRRTALVVALILFGIFVMLVAAN